MASPFRIPTRGGYRRVEYPEGSGRVALYSVQEAECLARLARSSAAGRDEARLVHALKAVFDATLNCETPE